MPKTITPFTQPHQTEPNPTGAEPGALRVLLTSHGSTGDIYPIIALGHELRQAGHSVRMASAPLYRKEVERAGLPYLHLPPDWGPEIFADFMRDLSRLRLPILQLRHIYRGSLPFLSELVERMEWELQWCDVLVGSYFFPHFRALAERQGKPYVSVAFCHNLVPTTARPPEGLPALRGLPLPLQRGWNQTCWRLGNRAVDYTVNATCGSVFMKHGLPPCRNFVTNPAELSMVAVSPELMDRLPHPPSSQFTGFLRWQSAENASADQQVRAFCGDGEVPVLTFGSVTFDHTRDVMNRFLRAWPEGQKIVIQSGWAGLSVASAREDILVVPTMSHDQLFQYASVIIHHGGAGTTASALHAGRPQIIVPHIADQRFWASEMIRLKVGRRVARAHWPEHLHRAVKRIENDTRWRERSESIARVVRAENGPRSAVAAIERFVASKRGQETKADRTSRSFCALL